MSVSELRQSWPTLTSVDHALVRRVVGGAFAVCPNSWAELDHLATYLQVTPDERWVVVRNGIWPDEVPDDLPWEARTPEVLCLGALSPRKNSLTLVRAARRAGLRLRIVGQEPDKLDGYGRRVMAACGSIRPLKPHEVEGRSCACLGRPEPTRRLGLSRRLAWPPWKQSQPVPPPLSLSVQLCRSTSPKACGVWIPDVGGVGGGGAGGGHRSSPPNDLSATIRAKYDWSVVLQPLASVLGSTP